LQWRQLPGGDSGRVEHYFAAVSRNCVHGPSGGADINGATATLYAGTIHFTSTDTKAVLPADYTFTSADQGIHVFTNGVTLKTAGTQSVTATDTKTSTIKGSQTGIVVNALPVSALAVSGISAPRTAGTASSVTVKAVDTFGNTITNYTGKIHLSSTDPIAALAADYTFVAADNGAHTFTNGVTLKTTGTQSVSATDVANASITGSQTGIVVNPAAAATLRVSGIASPRTVNTASNVTVEVKDSFGNRASGYTGTVHFTSTDSAAALPGNYKFTATDAGLHNFTPTTGGTVTLKTVATQSVTATDTVTASITGAQSGIQVVSNAATTLVVSGYPASATANTTGTVTVEARDAAGSRATGYTGTVTFTSSDPLASMPLHYQFTTGSTCTPSPCDNGIHSLFTVNLRTAGTQSITVTDTVTSSITGTQSGISISPGPAASLNVFGFPSPVTAGIAGNATVEARDAYGNRATGYAGSVQFTASDPLATVPGPVSFGGAQGILTISATFRTAGTQSVIAADSGTPSITGRQDGISVRAASATALTVSVAVPGGSLNAGQSTSATITALDPYGNIATGYTGTVHFSSSDSLATVPSDRTFTPADLGMAIVSGIAFRSAGSQSFTAADTLGGMSATQSGITVTAGAAASLVASGFPSSVIAGTAGGLTVTALDTFRNVATSYRGTVAFTSTDAQAALPGATAFTSADAGSRSFVVTLKTAGTQSISATDTANGSLTSAQSGIAVAPAGAGSLLVSGIPSPITTGTAASVTVDARDAFGNRATAYAGTVTFSSTDPQASLPSSYTFQSGDAGVHVFSGAVVLRTFGTQSVTATETTNSAISGTQSGISVLDGIAPTWPSGSTLTATATSSTSAHLAWTAATDNAAVTAYRLYQDGVVVQTLSGTTLATDVTGLAIGVTFRFQVQAGDAAGNWSATGPTASFTTVPPDPATLAPAVDQTIPTTMADATSFLYTGPNAIQTGVAPGTIDSKRVAVARGTVHDRAAQPISGVRVTVLSHPELGQTLTRADGAFDIAVNGGATLTLSFHKDGSLDSQRKVDTVWGEYVQVPDIVLVPQDQLVTVVDLTNTTSGQVVRGTVTTDELGQRQATVFVPPGTQATLVMPDGTTQNPSTLHVRATEFTIGSSGPQAMPAPLPPTTAYTYAVDFSADEAIAVGAKTVEFSQPIYGYVENFLAFRVGAVVPNGTFDADQGVWTALANGRVIKILSITGGLADIDTDGDGVADDATKLAAVNLSNAERQQLATIYPAGQSLWRMPLQHFSSDDWNPSPAPVPGARIPTAVKPKKATPPRCKNIKKHSIIECQTQALGEEVEVVGTPYTLNYRSTRQAGRRANYRLDVTVPGQVPITMPNGPACYPAPGRNPPCQPSSGEKILVSGMSRVTIAGRSFARSNDGPAPIVWQFEWDGSDAYGRRLQGEQPVQVDTCYSYPAVLYAESSDAAAAFANASSGGALLSWRQGSYSFEICQRWKGKLGGWDDRGRGLGGWTLSAHHAYDPRNQTLYRGDGERSSGTDLNRLVSNTPIGNGTFGTPTEGAAATAIAVGNIFEGLAVAPDGSVYFQSNNDVWKMRPDGTVTRVATQTDIGAGRVALAVGNDGLLYTFAAANGAPPIRLIRRESNGTFTTLLSLAVFSADAGIVIASDGAIYLSDSGHQRVLKLATDGSLTTVAGLANTTAGGYSGDGGPATQAQLNSPRGLALGRDGTLYIADSVNNRIRAVTTDGNISTVAGNGTAYNGFVPRDSYARDGSAATAAGIDTPTAVAIASDGTYYIADRLNDIRRVTPDGIIDTVANFDSASTCTAQTRDCPALHMNLFTSSAIAIAPDASIYFAENSTMVHRLTTGFTASTSASEIYVAAEDASEVYVFDLTGRHLRTLDALTTAVLQQFGYDTANRLVSVTDRDGNVTTIERDAQGNPTAIVSPYGQRTTLSLDGNGYLASITNPNSETVSLQYKPIASGDAHTGGLLSQLTDGRMGVHLFEHDTDGFLTKDTDPAGSYVALNRNNNLAPTQVTRSTPLGRNTTYQVSWSYADDVETSTVKDPANLTTMTVTKADQSSTTTYPDGTIVAVSTASDPRFGMDAFVPSATIKTPAGLTRTVTQTRTATMASAQDPLTLRTLVEQLTVNGKTYRSTYDSVAKTITQVTPAGRQGVVTLDSLGRVSQIQLPGVLPVNIQYDVHGRPQTVTQGSRTYVYGYDTAGRLQSIADPLHTVSLGYDGANRPISSTLPDLNVISAGYDGDGNLLSLTPPGRAAHTFTYQGGDLEQDYTPPPVDANGTGHVIRSYDLDQNITTVAPDGVASIVPGYDAVNGRLLTLGFSAGTDSYSYVPASGRLASITAPDGNQVSYGYDGPLLLTTTFSGGPAIGTVTRTYDSNFRLATEAVTGGQTITFQYDNDSLVTAAGALTIMRSPSTGFVTGTTLGSSFSDSHTYDSFGSRQTYSASFGTTPLYSVDYGTRDALGRVVTKTETVLGEQHVYGYSYDARGRLTDVTKDGAILSHYDYDANGNRLAAPGLAAAPTYDAQDRLLTYGNCSYSYKPDGSLQTKTCTDGVTSYNYDTFGNLRTITLPAGTTITYVIDGQNRRIAKKVNGAVVEAFLYRSRLKPAAWLNGDGSIRATFVYGLHQNVPEYMVQGATTYRFVTDQLGSVRLVVNTSTGAIVERIDWDEFGNVLSDSAPGTQPFGFAGGLRSLDTGLTRFGARDYDPMTGRWTTKDPLIFAGGLTNLYSYVGGDPINLIDPHGRLVGPLPLLPVIVPAGAETVVVGGLALAGAEGVLIGMAINHFAEPYIQALLWKYFGNDAITASKSDIKQVNDIARLFRMSEEERDEFGDFLEEEKRCGRGGSKNERGDFTWKELKEKARDFLGYEDDE
jgi:RHS repeat-associated protein